MTNDELDRQLRSVPVPERTPEYWQAFPQVVTRRIAAEATESSAAVARATAERGPRARTGWSWSALIPGAAAAFVGLAALFWLNRTGERAPGPKSAAVVRISPGEDQMQSPVADDEADPRAALLKVYQEVSELFPGRLKAIVLGQDGPQLQLSETADVPASPPVFVRLCGPAPRCTTAISFSGQIVHFVGGDVEVLTTGADEVFLLSRGVVWTPGGITPPTSGNDAPGNWRLDAGWLDRVRSDRQL